MSASLPRQIQRIVRLVVLIRSSALPCHTLHDFLQCYMKPGKNALYKDGPYDPLSMDFSVCHGAEKHPGHVTQHIPSCQLLSAAFTCPVHATTAFSAHGSSIPLSQLCGPFATMAAKAPRRGVPTPVLWASIMDRRAACLSCILVHTNAYRLEKSVRWFTFMLAN